MTALWHPKHLKCNIFYLLFWRWAFIKTGKLIWDDLFLGTVCYSSYWPNYVCPLRPIRVYIAHRWDSVSSIGRISFVRYYTWCGAFRHSGCKRTENRRGCVTWVSNIAIGFKENNLNLHNFFFVVARSKWLWAVFLYLFIHDVVSLE